MYVTTLKYFSSLRKFCQKLGTARYLSKIYLINTKLPNHVIAKIAVSCKKAFKDATGGKEYNPS